MTVESETEPKGERRVDAKVGEEEKTGEETRRGSRGADSETERDNLCREDMGGTR